jgi:hypothetical protein
MSHSVQTAIACPSCSTTLIGPYCHNCGEDRPDDHHFSWSHARHDAMHEFLHLDGKIFQTLWLLFRRPGFLTGEYWEGRKRLYIRPLRLYIVIAALHLFTLFSFVYRADSMVAHGPQGKTLEAMLNRQSARMHITPEQLKGLIDSNLKKAYSVLQYASVLGFSLVPWILYRRQRPYYLQHLIFSLHVFCFYFALSGLAAPLLGSYNWLRSPLPLVTLAYLYFALRFLYQERVVVALGKAIVLRLTLFAAEALAIALAMAISIFLSLRH